MWNYEKLTIRYKLTLMMMLTCVISLVLAGVLFIIGGYRFSRKSMIDNQLTQAQMMAESCQASVIFSDAEDAAETLSVLRSQPSIVYAGVHTDGEDDFASYYKEEIDREKEPVHKHDREDGYEFLGGFLTVYQSIMNEDEKIGVIVICSDLKPLRSMLARNISMVLAILMGISLIAYLLSSRFQRAISKPILDLTEVAQKVTNDKAYSVRAIKNSDDEIGVLVDSFNRMLEQVSKHKSRLVEMNEQLEEKVKHRTAELTEEVSEHKRTGETLKKSEERFKQVAESAGDWIWEVDTEGLYTYSSPPVEKILGYKPEEIVGKKYFYDFFTPEAKEESKKAAFERFSRKDSFKNFLNADRHKNGNTVVIESSGAPVIDDEGNLCGYRGADRDITERVRKEKELRKAQEELLEVSRKAGMAEVATDVLHNVGNVLNSVNVSTTLIHDAFTNSEIPNLKKVADMIEEHMQDLNTFFTQDPKGRHVPSYLVKAAKLLVNEQVGVVGKLDSLLGDVNHIKSIIKMQQEYAKVSGVEVATTVDCVIEDAIRINQTGLVQHKIRIVRDYEDLGEVSIDKQRVIQILVNLIGNAKYALAEIESSEKILKIRSFKKDENHLCIEVIDNGVGISQENLTKIFRHGFTTKKDGHGFGLHGGALAAKEMDGALSVHSEGAGHGATFTLDLPLNSVRAKQLTI